MAHCAELNQNNIVQRVIVTEDTYGELTCEQWCEQTYGGTWKQTSYNTNAGVHRFGKTPLRKNFAGVGYTYDPARDAFIRPQPFPSWILNEQTCEWSSPVACPNDGTPRKWDEAQKQWVLM